MEQVQRSGWREDELTADAARSRFRASGITPLPLDEQIAPLLAPGEQPVAVHRGALVDRREPLADNRLAQGVPGDLYVTTSRLILAGRTTVSVDLDAVVDAVPTRGRLLLILPGGRGVRIVVAQPRLLAVEMAAARAARRAETSERQPAER